MRIHIDPNVYPKVTKALEEVGATIVQSLNEAEGYVHPMVGSAFPMLPPHIKWVQLPSAGLNRYFDAGIITTERRWSNASGAYGRQVAEAAIALLLGLIHMHPTMVRTNNWSPARKLDQQTRWLDNSTVAIIGAGGIGTHAAEMLRPFAARSLAVTRTGQVSPDSASAFDEVMPISQLHKALGQADHVILAIPLTPDTRNLFGIAEFRAMKPDATIINVARGEIINTNDLLKALDEGEIAGAGLDVTAPEPLPAAHPLWNRDNVIITPHSANTIGSMDERLAPVVAQNYQLLMAGKPMITEVTPAKGY